jgi:hypothetical protein
VTLPEIKGKNRTTVNCFSHLAQISKLPTEGFVDDEVSFVDMDLEKAVYASLSSSSQSSLSFFVFLLAFPFAFSFSLPAEVLLSFRFLAVGASSSELSRCSES